MKKHIFSLAAIAAAALLAMQCNKNCPENVENYRDALFEQMLADTTWVHEERLIQEADSVAFYAHMEQPLLWPETTDTTLRQMVDFFNYKRVRYAVATDEQTIQRYDENYDELLKEMIASWKKIKMQGVSDTTIKKAMYDALAIVTENTNQMPEGKNPIEVLDELEFGLVAGFPDIDSAQMRNEIIPKLSPKTYLPKKMQNEYDSLVGKDANPDQETKQKLYDSYLTEENYNTKLSMLFVLLYNYDMSVSDTTAFLLKEAETAFTSGNYSPVMPVLWRAYRVVYCTKYRCPSTYCEIPNVRFNYYRRLVAYTSLKYIESHPDDMAAKVLFYCLAFRTNIDRFGEYYFGNQSAAEEIYLFWNGDVL
ncbi:MAG: hypothetical protein IKX51_07610 [Bacteroidales bacterium]|nr:hypothetical protein [Bacteroidales bacterium]